MIEFFKGTVTPKDILFVAVVLAVAGLLCVGFYFGIYTNQQTQLADVRAELDVVQKDLREAREIAANIDALREEATKMEQLVDLFEKRLPDEREIPMLLRRFEGLGQRAGLRVQLSQLPTSADANKETIPYKVTAEGTFHQIMHFINLLERDERYLKISDLDIGEEKANASRANFTLSTFRFLQSATRTVQATTAAGKP